MIEPTTQQTRRSAEIPFWRDERVLRIAAQIISAVVVIGLIVWVISNVIQAATQRGLSLGFNFLSDSAGFPIGETVIPYDPSRSFAYAFIAGVLSTLKVSIIGVILSTILGTFIGVIRLSSNWLVSKLALAYIEIHRNIPLLVLLFLWYSGVFLQLPRVQNSIVWPGPTFINQRGMYMTWPRLTSTGQIFLISIVVGVVLALIAWIVLSRVEENTGRSTYYGWVSLALLILTPVAGWF